MKNIILRFICALSLLCPIAQSAAVEINILNELARDRALSIIHKYKVFMEDYFDFSMKELRKGNEDYNYNQTEINFHIRSLEKKENFINSLPTDNKNFIDKILRDFFSSRFSILDYRYDLFKRRELVDDKSERMSEKIACNTTMCQFYDELISETFHIYMSLTDSHVDILRLVSLSPTLWPLLKGETRELPDPDHAIYSDSTRSKLRTDFDLYLFLTYEKPCAMIRIPIYGLGVPNDEKMKVTTSVTQYERSLFDKRYSSYKKGKEIQIPEWVTTQQCTLLEQETTRKVSHEDEKAISPRFSTVILTEKAVTEEISEKSDVIGAAAEEDIFLGNLENDYAAGATHEETPVAICDIFQEEGFDLQGSIPSPVGQAEVAPKILKTLKTNPYEKPLPRGLRVFHPHEQSFRTNFKRLSSKHQSTLEKIREGKAESVSYADFSSLWKAINGETSIEESSGSSHKVLHDASGKKVTGIFAHNKGMTYTRKTIPYLHAAIQMLGDKRLTEETIFSHDRVPS
ncbi:MAG: hypothetical protein ACK4V2_07365 [Pseudomonadota bacterium]|jgi:hypothetical protein|nr:hypothetical protein [Alphaproteobacteria bacterium]